MILAVEPLFSNAVFQGNFHGKEELPRMNKGQSRKARWLRFLLTTWRRQVTRVPGIQFENCQSVYSFYSFFQVGHYSYDEKEKTFPSHKIHDTELKWQDFPENRKSKLPNCEAIWFLDHIAFFLIGPFTAVWVGF